MVNAINCNLYLNDVFIQFHIHLIDVGNNLYIYQFQATEKLQCHGIKNYVALSYEIYISKLYWEATYDLKAITLQADVPPDHRC
jgi:hypothetical protein